MKLKFLCMVLLVSLIVASTSAAATVNYYEKYNRPMDEDKDKEYEEKYIEVPSYSGHKRYRLVRSIKWTPTSTVRYGTYGPEEPSVGPALSQPLTKVEKRKTPKKIQSRTTKEGKTFTGKRTGKIVRINYNGRYDYGLIKKDNSAFKLAFTAEHDKFDRWDHVKFDLKRVNPKQSIAVNLVKIK